MSLFNSFNEEMTDVSCNTNVKNEKSGIIVSNGYE